MSHLQTAARESALPLSICLFCGSSDAVRPAYLQAASAFGAAMAEAGARLIYGGGGVGLMGAASKAAHAAGGRVLGVMPEFLQRQERLYDEVETVVVQTMHERKRIMFEQSDAFAVLPGGIGTLEEVIELMSWRRLDLHRKPIVFLDQDGFWRPLFAMLQHTAEEKFTPAWLEATWGAVDGVEQILPMIRKLQAEAADGPGFHGYPAAAEVAAKG
jgi:hypothetical protein